MLEHKIAEAKANKRKRFVTIAITVLSIALICAATILFTVSFQSSDKTDLVYSESDNGIDESVVSENVMQQNNIANDELRESYIDLLADYENNIEPELGKIDILKWDKPRSEKLSLLKEQSLSKFSSAEYGEAYTKLQQTKQFAENTIADSQKLFSEVLGHAQAAYDVDDYKQAKMQIDKALMLDNHSEEAVDLSNKIDRLSEILPLIEQAKTANVENNHEKELGLIKQIIALSPERKSAIERKMVLIDIITNKNFKFNIKKSYAAIAQGDSVAARRKLQDAKKIFPGRQEIKKVESAILELESNQRFEKYQQAAEKAMASDDWSIAKQQLELALKEHQGDALILTSLSKATSIINLNQEFTQLIAKPYSLSNEIVASKAKQSISDAAKYTNNSPGLKRKTDEISSLIKEMNKKVSVEVVSDNQTHVLVRGVGMVGETLSKTIQLSPGQYKFEGKRKGYKSKLIDVFIKYDKPNESVIVICDEPI
jgi:tetratricopeptide (TPR) repeat protein